MTEQLLNIKFVSEVEKHPCLYNYNLKEYSKKHRTEKAWAEVAKAVNFTAPQAKEKWKNLRSVFGRNLKRTPKRSQYYLNDAMQFAKPFIKICTGNGSCNRRTEKREQAKQAVKLPANGWCDQLNEPSSQAEQAAEDEEESVDDNETETVDEDAKVEIPQLHSSFIGYDDPLSPATQTNAFLHVSSPQHSYHYSNTSEIDNRFNDYLKLKMAKTDAISPSHANKMFLLSLLPDLNGMTQSQVRSFKRQVIGLIESISTNDPTTSTETQQLDNSS